MDAGIAFLMFFAGAISHLFASRIFGMTSSVFIFKRTLINCFILLKYTSSYIEILHKKSDNENDEVFNVVLSQWKNLSILTLRRFIPVNVWLSLKVSNWDEAMELVSRAEKSRS